MKVIATNDFYSITVDEVKNRLDVVFRGNVVKPKDWRNVVPDMERAVELVRPGFKLMSDCSTIGVILLLNVVKDIQAVVAKAQPGKVASVWSEQILGQLQLQSSAEHVGQGYADKRKHFTNRNIAEEWLAD
ncbi:MAG: hypothetical protein AB1646_25415 [Thermodesulfobacteriota bacterium]